MPQVDTIRQKLDALGKADANFEHFGAQQHKYRLNPRLTEEEVAAAEEKYRMKLPDSYRQFVLEVGDGGAGPYYGIRTLADALKYGGIVNDPDIVSRPFLLEKPLRLFDECAGVETWDEYYRRIEEDEDYYEEVLECKARYNAPYYRQGTLYICNYGDGIAFYLVITGAEKGNLWIDDRTGDFGGIFPLSAEGDGATRISFLAWYEKWLDDGLTQANDGEAASGGYFEFA